MFESILSSKEILLQMLKITGQTSLFIVSLFLYIKVFKIKSPALKYFLWVIAGISVVLIPATTWMFSKAGVSFNFGDRLRVEKIATEDILPLRPADITDNTNEPAANPVLKRSISPASFYNTALLILLIGLVLMVRRLFTAYFYLRRIERNAAAVRPPAISEIFSNLKEKFNISREVELKLSSEISLPITTGVVKPAILIPVKMLNSLSNEELEQILTHEFAHIKRCDFLSNLFFQFIQCIFFFHPLIWIANRMLRIERERICDQWVIYVLKQPESYARCLFNLARGRMLEASISPAAIGIVHVKSKMGRRIEMIMNMAKGTVPKLTRKNVMLTSAMVVVMLSIASWVGTGELKAERAECEKREQGERREGEKRDERREGERREGEQRRFISEDARHLMEKAEQLDRSGGNRADIVELKEKAEAIEREARSRREKAEQAEWEKREQGERREGEKRDERREGEKHDERREAEKREGGKRKFISEDAIHLMQKAEQCDREGKRDDAAELKQKAEAIEREARSRREKAERAELEKRGQGERREGEKRDERREGERREGEKRDERHEGERREGEKPKFISEDARHLMEKAEQLEREAKEAHTHAAELREKAMAIEREARSNREKAGQAERENQEQGERREREGE